MRRVIVAAILGLLLLSGLSAAASEPLYAVAKHQPRRPPSIGMSLSEYLEQVDKALDDRHPTRDGPLPPGTVQRRDSFIRGLADWTKAVRDTVRPEFLIIEMINSTASGARYKRLVLYRADAMTTAAMKTFHEEGATALDARYWTVITPYAGEAAKIGSIGRYGIHTGGFNVILLSYFDGDQWHCAEYREYMFKDFYDHEALKKLATLERLEEVLFFGLDIGFGGPSGFGGGSEVERDWKLLKAMREEGEKRSSAVSPVSSTSATSDPAGCHFQGQRGPNPGRFRRAARCSYCPFRR